MTDSFPAGVSSLFSFRERVVLPGDDVTDDVLAALPPALAARLGAGLAASTAAAAAAAAAPAAAPTTGTGAGAEAPSPRVLATRAGVLAHRAPDRFFVLSAQRRYAPAVGDTVVGVVADRAGGAEASYRVRLHGTGVARLPELAFDGASKRNKPALAVGSVVFARVAAVGAHVDAELSCCVQSGPRRDWMTGQALFGELRGGTLVRVSTALARRLLDPGCALLAALGRGVPFELAVGLNGCVWVLAREARQVAAVAAVLERAEFLDDAQSEALVAALVAARGAALDDDGDDDDADADNAGAGGGGAGAAAR
jgi:exosome complex component RRP40